MTHAPSNPALLPEIINDLESVRLTIATGGNVTRDTEIYRMLVDAINSLTLATNIHELINGIYCCPQCQFKTTAKMAFIPFEAHATTGATQ